MGRLCLAPIKSCVTRNLHVTYSFRPLRRRLTTTLLTFFFPGTQTLLTRFFLLLGGPMALGLRGLRTGHGTPGVHPVTAHSAPDTHVPVCQKYVHSDVSLLAHIVLF